MKTGDLTVTIGVDLETFGGQTEPSLDDIKPGGRLKDEEKIRADILKKQGSEWKAQALKPGRGEIFCIGMCIDKAPPYIVTGTDEEELMLNFSKELKGFNYPTFYAHNGYKFDFRFLFFKALKYRLRDLAHTFSNSKSPHLVDTMVAMAGPGWGERTSLNDMHLTLFNKPAKGEIDGSMVHDYVMAGRGQEICDYCIEDVAAMQRCYYALDEMGLIQK